ncbi:MAG: sensor histidine kinase, partial [Candidatus Gastranaerophilaceae bacterium]
TKVEDVWVPEVLEEAKMLIKNKDNKEIIFNIPEDFPLVKADKDRLGQVFVNLLENAAKYANPDSKIMTVAVHDEKHAKIFVQNECDIIPPEKLDKLFEKFIRLDDNTTRTTRGTGLGLFIVKGLIEAMEGTIELHSDEKCGFCVEVTLNLAAAGVKA